jgi:hypothetical protein
MIFWGESFLNFVLGSEGISEKTVGDYTHPTLAGHGDVVARER